MKFEDYLKNKTRDFKLKYAMMRAIWVIQMKKMGWRRYGGNTNPDARVSKK